MSQTILSPGLQVWGPGPVAAVNGTGSNSTGNTGPLSGNGLQSILIAAIPAAAVVVMILLPLTVSFYKFVIRRPEAQRAQANEIGVQQEKAGVPLQPLYREMPLIVVQPNEEVFLAKREGKPEQDLPAKGQSAGENESSASSAPSEVFVVVTQPQ